MADGDGPTLRFGFDIAGSIHALEHGGVGELWQVARDGIVELQLAFLVQHEHGHRGDRLAHAEDAKARVERHRDRVLPILHADSRRVHELAVTSHENGVPACRIALRFATKELAEVREALRRHAYGFGIRFGQRSVRGLRPLRCDRQGVQGDPHQTGHRRETSEHLRHLDRLHLA